MAMSARLPDFFIVGQPKSGTTALYEMLRRHPQVFMPELKETWFFAQELRNPRRGPERRHPDTLEQYLALFAPAAPQQRIGEASPSYLWSRFAAARIAQARPDARIIAILREPASFLHSLHLQYLQSDIETEKDFRTAIELEPLRREGKAMPRSSTRPEALFYSDQVRYVEQLRRYQAVFAPEQILVLIYDDFRADNEAAVRRVLRLLHVDDRATIESVEANPAVRVRSPRLQGLTRSLYLGRSPTTRAAKQLIMASTPRGLRRRALAMGYRAQLGKPRPPDPAWMLQLRRRFTDEVVQLGEHLERDLATEWGYDQLD
jgi:hypothetical protein